MPLTTAQATVLGRSVVAFRQQWDLAGCMTFIDQLATDPRPALVLWQQIVTRAADPRSLTPKALLEPLPTGEAVVRTITPAPPRHDDEHCPDCGSTVRDVNGDCVGCKQNAAMNATPIVRPVAAPFRAACPAPAGLRERVAAALPNASRVGAREVSQEKEPTNG